MTRESIPSFLQKWSPVAAIVAPLLMIVFIAKGDSRWVQEAKAEKTFATKEEFHLLEQQVDLSEEALEKQWERERDYIYRKFKDVMEALDKVEKKVDGLK